MSRFILIGLIFCLFSPIPSLFLSFNDLSFWALWTCGTLMIVFGIKNGEWKDRKVVLKRKQPT